MDDEIYLNIMEFSLKFHLVLQFLLLYPPFCHHTKTAISNLGLYFAPGMKIPQCCRCLLFDRKVLCQDLQSYYPFQSS